MTNKVFFAKEAVIKLQHASSTTITTAAALPTFFSSGTAIEGVMKDISITESVGDVDKIDLLGNDSNGFQNAEMEEKPAAIAELTGTMILPGDEVTESFLYPTASATPAGYSRYRSGKSTVQVVSVLLQLTDGVDSVSYALDNAYMTAHETKVTGADGHFENTVTLKCLPRDYYGPEFKD